MIMNELMINNTDMQKPICVRSSVHVQQPKDFNHWQQELKEERDFLRLIDDFKRQIIHARTKQNK